MRAKALASGADECYVEDLREEFVRDFIFPTLRAGAIYNRKYLLGTSMARPLIAQAPGRSRAPRRRRCARARLHRQGQRSGSLRADLRRVRADLPVIAPWREWDIRSREDAIAYADAHNVPVAATQARRSTRATPTSGTSRTKAASSRIRTPRRRTICSCSPAPSTDAPDTPENVVDRLRAGHAGVA